VIKINNRKLLNGLLSAIGVSTAGQKLAVLRAVDKLDRLGNEGVLALLGAGRKDESGAFTKGAGLNAKAAEQVLAFTAAGGGSRSAVLDRLSGVIGASPEGEEGLLELSKIAAALTAMGVGEDRALIEPSVVRGLEYYTGAVFEAELTLEILDEAGKPARFGSIGGGGRYDDLVARFTGDVTPATGFSFGVSRLAAALAAAGRAGADPRGPVVVINFDESGTGEYFAAAASLRAAGIAAEVYLGSSGMKAQMKYADRRRSPAAVIIGGDEIAAGTVTVKDLDLGRALASGLTDHEAWAKDRPGQQTVPKEQLVAVVRAIVDRA
jgi:histidyl-tRNA synthetase